jgi:hypothetical protein
MAYTFFLRGFAPVTREGGLSLSHAFDRVTSASGYHHRFEQEDGRVVLTLSRHRAGETPPIIIKATADIEGDGEDEVMVLAMDGRLGGFMAVPDVEYAAYLNLSSDEMDEAAIRFLVLTALKTHIHVIPKVREMQTGHAKRMLDAGVESLAQAVSQAITAPVASWLENARHKSFAEAD